MKRTKETSELLEKSNSLINQVSELIQEFENLRDYSRDLTSDESNFYKLLYFIYDLLAKLKTN